MIAFCTTATNQQITNLINVFKNGITSLSSIVTQITAISGAQSLSPAGGGSQKDLMRLILDRITFSIINAAKGYYLSVPDLNIVKKLDYALSSVQEISDKNIEGMIVTWKGYITPVMTELSDWGINDDTILSWDAALLNYKKAYTLPELNKKTKSSLTLQVNELTKQGMTIVKSTLETSVNSFIQKGPPAICYRLSVNRQ
ncbi:MAG: hypothetical protein ABIT08_15975 [Bacteroidia bacterium]